MLYDSVLLQNEHVRVQYHDVAVGVFYSGPVMHRIVNTGNTPIHNLIVELKGVTR